jgi:hypothetical protein
MTDIPNTRQPAGGKGPTLGLDGNLPPTLWSGRQLDYVQFTADVSVTATTEATANTVVTSSTLVYNGLPIMVEFYAPYQKHSNALGRMTLVLYDQAGSAAAASIGFLSVTDWTTAAFRFGPVLAHRRLVPTPDQHIYSVRAFVGANTGTVAAGTGVATAYMPGFLRISYNSAGATGTGGGSAI